MRRSKQLLTLLILWSISLLCSAQSPLMLNQEKSLELTRWLYYLQDHQLSSIDEVKALGDKQWKHFPPKLNRNVSMAPFWIKFSLYNASHEPMRRYLSLNNPLIDKISLYHLHDGEAPIHIEMGDNYPFSQRPVENNHFVYGFDLPPKSNATFFIRIESEGSADLPLILYPSQALIEQTQRLSFYQGLQLGGLLAIGLFSLFMAMVTRSFSYGYYAGYVLSVTLLLASLHGIAFRYFWPNLPMLQHHLIPALIPLSLTFALLFTEKVLQLKYHSLGMLRLCRYSTLLTALLILVTPLLSYSQAFELITSVTLLLITALMLLSITLSLRDHKLAKFYTLAWAGMFAGTLITTLMYLDIIELPLLHQTPMLVGLTFEVVFMTAVLAVRYDNERKAKLKIQQEALAQAERLRQSREDALKLEAQTNEKLEQMVQQRTLELEIALRELNEANQKLTEQNATDSLTGVKNRAAFEKRLLAEGRLSRRQQTPLAILMIDIDHFKAINDTYGHLAGDETLRLIAQALKQKIRRPSDLVSRFGGEEFAMILPNTSEEGARNMAELMRQTISQLPLSWEQNSIQLTISIGLCAEVVTGDEHLHCLVERADKALYCAKKAGRDRVCVYSPELEQ
ncbi:diguanylate cyclase [Shewanella sp. AS1]|uniref:sensor domain-containing diguanylate cyclase n=1 Tax=Shewanella sp. AS1 TaxID=2907626 RepID=UPI001F34DF7D|nr:diguanylate cyclase [Shewanella sp. AS1]MCE9679925.1 diguanylate cyclase [Shewanella sp. AS1]